MFEEPDELGEQRMRFVFERHKVEDLLFFYDPKLAPEDVCDLLAEFLLETSDTLDESLEA